MVRRRIGSLIGWSIGWFVCSLGSLCFIPSDNPLDHDEIYWIGSAYYYDLAFVQRDWTHPAWRLLPARENPPVAKYVFGLGLAARGYHVTSIDSLSYFYLFWLQWENDPTARTTGADGEKRAQVVEAASPGFRQRILESRHAPLTRPVVQAARDTSLLCTLMASLLLLGLGLLSSRPLAGLLASQLLLVHPAIRSAASHAMSDSVALMFSIAAVVALFHWHRRLSKPGPLAFARSLPSTGVVGVMLALACGAKMNSLVIVIFAGVLAIMVAVQKWQIRDRRGMVNMALHFLLATTVALVVFVVINPAIMQDLPGGLAATVLEHRRTETLQTDLAHGRLVALLDRLRAVANLGFLGWGPFIAGLFVLTLFVINRRKDPVIIFAVGWWIVAFLSVTAWIPFHWSRYVIPVLPPSVWLVSLAIVAGFRTLLEFFGVRLAIADSRTTPDA